MTIESRDQVYYSPLSHSGAGLGRASDRSNLFDMFAASS